MSSQVLGITQVRTFASTCSDGSRISPRRGRQLPRGALAYDFAIFSQKLHEIERIWTPRGARIPGAPLGSATDLEQTVVVMGQSNVFTGACPRVRGLCMMSFPVWLTGPMFLRGGLCLWGLCQGDPLDRDPPWIGTSRQRSPLNRDPPGQRPSPLDREALDRDPSWTETPPEQRPPGLKPPDREPQTETPWIGTPHMVKSGWFTSYWNAFLINIVVTFPSAVYNT